MATAAPTKNKSAAESKFNWPLCYEAEKFILDRVDAFLQRNNVARVLAKRMRDESGTLILDWTDHLLLPAADEKKLRELGYVDDSLGETQDRCIALWHPAAMLPRVLIAPSNARFPLALAIRPEFVADFAGAHGLTNQIEGQPFSRFRKLTVGEEKGTQLFAIERRGYRGYVPQDIDLKSYLEARELWQTRKRLWADDAEGYAYTQSRVREIIDLVGRDLACHLFFEEERRYWEKRNRAGREQKLRQDSLGLGWANHDHHTFRSSREYFVDLIKVLEMLGFDRRERYYAGSEAGWGAQVLEQPIEGIVVFADVDLTPEETEIDFSRVKLNPEKSLGTVQLWCGLHGESLLEAGMHHLECRFDHALLRDQFASIGINMMEPFSDFPFLKQAFTEGERWPVRRERLQKLHAKNLITDEQLQKFAREGAIGSHLENLQRKGGFKGFNQHAVSLIIADTDPRKQKAQQHTGA
ncbi:MAG TPA: hypothetical protein VE758_09855 [Chthoniobacterales bacterium]|nr:hypothetical protein [Chthoniobacterales bacterium]